MSLKLNSSGGGSVTLQEPTTASNVTLNLPAADGTVVYENASGNVGIGTSSPAAKLTINQGSTGTYFRANASTADRPLTLTTTTTTNNGDTHTLNIDSGTGIFAIATDGTERARIDSSGNLLVGTTSSSPDDANVTGVSLQSGGAGIFSASGAAGIRVNRKTNDGDLVEFKQDGTKEGSISVSGTTVSYNSFAGSHWSQLQDGSKPEILRGTVMESIDELCQWPDEPTSERLCRSKISDTAASKRVYGVFMDWDHDWTVTNDMMVTSLGAFICRVNAGVTVQMGDLLESNGDGTARVQADDIIRSSTIGKVTSTTKTHEYDDGSYCVPTVLYCG